MKKQTRILTGTALALVMAAGSGIASPQRPGSPSVVDARITHGEIILAQADEELSEEELRRRQQQENDGAPAEEQSAPESEVEEPAPPAEEPPAPPAEEPAAPAEQPAPPPVEEPAPAPEQPAPPPVEEPATPEAPPTPQEAPAEPTPEQPPVPQEAPAAPPAETAPAAEDPAPTPEQPPMPETPPAQETPEAAPAPAEQPAAETPTEPAAPTPPEAAPAEPAPAAPAPAEPAAPASENEAPLFDSQKEGETGQPAPATEPAPTAPAQPAAPPPATDAEAQQLEAPVEVQPLRAEEGRRIERRTERRERREGANVLGEIGDRIILQFGGQTIVQSDDRDRIGRDASEVYYEELPRGRTRETVTRANGVQVVTIRDRYGDIVRRSRITPDGREYVLVYAEDRERDRGERRQWRDPARDLPPLRIDIPRDEYILDARRAKEPEDYYEFFEQPPVEPIRRLYSIDEVKYSARVRDSVRRVDMDTITFEFGAATISESEIGRLESVADAMARLLERNPAETFLIEGHTDAVGSDQANLALSDRRAESVAAALTNVFGIPPENLVTQGYGERYLKVNSQAPERENRRVAMRRITPLVAPVAQAQ